MLPDVDVHVVCQRHHAQRFADLIGADRVVAIPGVFTPVPLRLLWEQLVLPSLARKLGADVIHSPHYTLPLFTRIARVVTLHDATFFSHPELHSGLKRRFFQAWSRLAVRKADACIVPSYATRDELCRFLAVQPDHFFVAHSGVDTETFHLPSAAEVAAAAAAANLENKKWIAFLATIEPRKNLRSLIEAFATLWLDETFRTKNPHLVLAIAGADGWGEHVSTMIASLPTGVPVQRVGYLDTGLLAGYLGGAELVAYPSLGEGFGLPVLEAMASGGPVLTTRMLALPEVGGDAVAYTGITPEEIAVDLKALIDSPKRRRELASSGTRRAAEFTWAASAVVHVAAYVAAMGAAPARRAS